ncbi:HEPN domain-containing protein [Mycobacterium montefiorense]|uniref:Apea-like HEPN domain-containing protein n=1 Tax=Mycobacterium montefiorense TaxID=154654 RepID=A0AA37V0L2_9MYCO|nr:HEPN domain-containing protein [Mycobacterium montefiorense]GBG36770.1 hypothetical protein MmonteBS_11420 [Mycobacterium montefiorense]GKU37530.1 hypothetical protein NJB14191_48760 [Mycobacterium montefiorense]GKU42602.1 hypothetical protein NJB14192_45850 [Mycobacterium montefiorense]GKU48720.1 hypothetical protein NJB14194_53350 [Mycobacterium montefiorense]GKU50745.1 hypothetical protein NJB14195_19910 [Mycobacterium montefiorense]
MTYSFRNRFTIFDDRLNIDAHIHELADTGVEHVVLRAGTSGTMIKDTGDLVVEGSRYPDEGSAVAAGREWRRALTVAFARSHAGADFGPDDSVTPSTDMIVPNPPDLFAQMGIDPGDRIVSDEHGLLVVTSEPRPKFFFMQAHGAVARGDEQFVANLNNARERSGQNWSPEKALAHRVVASALRDTNPETQHIQLTTAVEVLLQQQDRPQDVFDVLSQFINDVEQGDEGDIKKRLLDILREDLEESISRAACDQLLAVLTDTYDGKTVDTFFRRVYDMRSRLLHRKRRKKEKRPTPTELSAVHFELLRMVLDFLDASE